MKQLNREGRYYALYCSLESVQGIIEPEKGIPAVIDALKSAFRITNIKGDYGYFAKDANYSAYSSVLTDELSKMCLALDKPLVIFFDEADCLSNGTLITFLRQLRNGYNTRSISPFVHSLALVGMRNIRDYKAHIRPDSEMPGSASPFNIVTEALTLRNFTKEEIRELYMQHTAETGQVFEEAAIARAWQQTQGQPWLVNAIARDVIYKILDYDFTHPVTVALVDQAIERIIMRRDTHIDSLLERLKEERVRKVIEPVITGGSQKMEVLSDDFRYVHDLGLIRNDRGPAEPAPHLILQAFLQRVVNGGGHIAREMAAERRRVDLCVIFKGHKYPIDA